MHTLELVQMVLDEMSRQKLKFGEQNHPILLTDKISNHGVENVYGIPTEKAVKELVDTKALVGGLSYFDILLEEVVEVANCKNAKDLRTELIQVTAVALSMIESLDRNGK
jgi:hypothetical protein